MFSEDVAVSESLVETYMLLTYFVHLKGPSDRTWRYDVVKKSPILAEDVAFFENFRSFFHLKGPSDRNFHDVNLQYLKQYRSPPEAKSSDLRS